MRKRLLILLGLIVVASLAFTSGGSLANGEATRIVVINEVAWGGTAADPGHEWIELHNTTDSTIDLSGWTLTAVGGAGLSIAIENGKTISAQDYFLLERDDMAVTDIEADQVYGSLPLSDDGETLELRDAGGGLIDTVNDDGGEWPAGTADPGYFSMERIRPTGADIDENWTNNDGVTHNGVDAGGNPINGTPKKENSVVEPLTVITLISFTATPGDGTVTLAWETGTEIDTAGFNLYRADAEEAPTTRINDALIPAEGDAVSGANYSFLDTPGCGVFYYTLEDVDYYGVSTLHGPVEVTVLQLVWPPLPPLPSLPPLQDVPISCKSMICPDWPAARKVFGSICDAAVKVWEY